MQGAALTAAERTDHRGEAGAATPGSRRSTSSATNLRIDIMRFTQGAAARSSAARSAGSTAASPASTATPPASASSTIPSLAAIIGPYTGAINDYVRGELKFESDLPYEILTGRVQPWSFSEHQNRYVDVGETLRNAMTQNPYLKVFVANGYYDLATPYFATEYTFNHLGLDPSLRANVTMGYYEAGHMMYIHQPSLRQLKSDIASFMKTTLAGAPPPARPTAQE